uniref:ABC-2 type transporter transmembrane domain-containing protein n=1 Tax=Sphenodon punctatus TaxID=8508 RepID=A0A8D0HBP5_SPHPU
MATDALGEVGVWRQTRALLFKNCIVKWRTKKSSVQEVLFPLFFLFWLVLMSVMHPNKKYGEVPDAVLSTVGHSISDSLIKNFVLGFTPATNTTRKIMQKVSMDCSAYGILTEEFLSEEALQESSLSNIRDFVGIVFKDSMSYQLRFFPDSIPVSAIYLESRASCSGVPEECEAAAYWHSGFIFLQACIYAAIIQLKTNRSVWEELESTKAVIMGESAVMEIDNFPRAIILIYLVIAFSPFGYYLAVHIVAEKEKKLKEFLMIMGLHDTAFWYVSINLTYSVVEKHSECPLTM